MMLRAGRSLTEPPGLNHSAFARNVTFGKSEVTGGAAKAAYYQWTRVATHPYSLCVAVALARSWVSGKTLFLAACEASLCEASPKGDHLTRDLMQQPIRKIYTLFPST